MDTLVPRLKALREAGCRVLVDYDNYSHEVELDEDGKPYAICRFFGDHRTYINRQFFDMLYSPTFSREGPGFVPDYTLEDALNTLWVEVTVWNYKTQVAALTAKENHA